MKIKPALLVLVMPLYWLCLCNHVLVVSGLCLDDQMSLLLQLKNNFTSESSIKLKSWDPSDDCCSWMGVECDNEGHVTGLDLSHERTSGGLDKSSSLFKLQHLMNLNLNFINITIPAQEWCDALLQLRNLQVLRMVSCNLKGPLGSSLPRLENLSVLILDFNNMSSLLPETFANFKNLTILSLVYCQLIGRFPPKIFHIATLTYIDISSNVNLQGFFLDFPLSGSLQTIKVSNTNFSGTLPTSVGNLRHLSVFDLSRCQFNGTLPSSLSNLTELTDLRLLFNKFTGPMPSFGMAKNVTQINLSNNELRGAIPSSYFETLHNLVRIDLSHNYITGSVPASLFTLPLLQVILLSDNHFSQLDEFINVSSSVLNFLDLRNNNVSGPFPDFIFQLNALQTLRLSSNKFHGPLHLHKFWELIILSELDISHNNLSANVDMTNVDHPPFPILQYLYMSSCNLKTFPDYLRNQSTLTSLDLSKNQIHGVVPNWLWELPYLESLNLSSNLLTYLEGPMQNQNYVSSLKFLDLHDNQLHGPILIIPADASYLDYSRNKFSSVIPQDIGNHLSSAYFLSLSNNKFHGNIPESLCSAENLVGLDLSINNISGTIPSCLMSMQGRMILNLRENNLIGSIPDMFPATYCFLVNLNLHGNHLHGPIPKSLTHCHNLEVLDLGKNQISGGFPCFLKNMSLLRVLVLRNNKFQGSLGCEQANKQPWKQLQIVDISFNNFSGKLKGSYFTNWGTMMHDEEQSQLDFIHTIYLWSSGYYYQDGVTITNKGLQMDLVKIPNVFRFIDFSSNHFGGPIPKELMDFKKLHALNLSNNALSGEIPSSIGNMKQLESLDLSQNSFHGEIPVQLAKLTFLSHLNLSFNHLVGKIPTGTQLQSFQASSFKGNEGLHGLPLAEKPDGKKQVLLQDPPCKRLACSVDWNFLSAELGFSCGIGIVILPLLFWKQWRIWYWKLVDRILCWIFPQLYLYYVTHGGKKYTVLRWWR